MAICHPRRSLHNQAGQDLALSGPRSKPTPSQGAGDGQAFGGLSPPQGQAACQGEVGMWLVVGQLAGPEEAERLSGLYRGDS